MRSSLPTVDDGGPFWRVVVTDTESASGVAPVCTSAETNHYIEDDDGAPAREVDHYGVYDCCPQPHLECWSERVAAEVVDFLNDRTVRICE